MTFSRQRRDSPSSSSVVTYLYPAETPPRPPPLFPTLLSSTPSPSSQHYHSPNTPRTISITYQKKHITTTTVKMSEAFKKAAEDSKKLTSKPNNDELLELYGIFGPLLPMSLLEDTA